MELRLTHNQNHVSHAISTTFGHSSNFHVKTSRSPKPMINLILSMPISFIKSKHPSIFTYIIFRKNNLNNTCNKSSKQSRKHSTHSQTRSSEKLASLKQRILAQARYATGVFTNSRLGETSSPERDRASLKTWTGRLGERSRQNLRRASDILA